MEVIMNEGLLKEGTKVSSEINGGLKGTISGVSMNELPVIGTLYIIKIIERTGRPWKSYPYSCVTLPQTLFTVDE